MKQRRKLSSLFGLIWTKRAMNRRWLFWTMQILNQSRPICIQARRSSSSKIANANTQRPEHARGVEKNGAAAGASCVSILLYSSKTFY
jgi:hypothetical protein